MPRAPGHRRALRRHAQRPRLPDARQSVGDPCARWTHLRGDRPHVPGRSIPFSARRSRHVASRAARDRDEQRWGHHGDRARAATDRRRAVPSRIDHDAEGRSGVSHHPERPPHARAGARERDPLMDAREALAIVVGGQSLTRAEAESAMGSVMAGESTPAQLGALLAALHIRGETPDEVAGFASALRANAVRVEVADGAIDVVGTGGDRSNSINISTLAALVTAGAGGRVAKHGNRAASSACGSADVLEALGVRIDLGPEGVAACVDELGVYGTDGLDEVSPSAETRTWEIRGGAVTTGTLTPDDVSVARAPRSEIV